MADTLADLVVRLSADFSGSTSQVNSFIAKLEQMEGQSAAVSDAVDKIATATSNAAAPLAEVGESAAAAAEQLALFDEASQIPFEDEAGQLNLFATELEPIAGSAQSAAEAMEELAQGAADAGEASENSAEGVGEVGERAGEAGDEIAELGFRMLEYVGIVFALDAVKDAVEESFTAFARVQRATEALTELTGSAKEAEVRIAALEEQARDQALSFPELLTAHQRLAVFIEDGDQINRALRAAADASRVAGTDFGNVTTGLTMMAQQGVVMRRQLGSLAISMDDLARVMQVSVDDVQKQFKELDQSERLDVLTEALDKHKGAAERTAHDLAGSWQNMKNAADEAFEASGKALEGLAHSFLAQTTQMIGDIKDTITYIQDLGKEMGALSDTGSALKKALAYSRELFDDVFGLGLLKYGVDALTSSQREQAQVSANREMVKNLDETYVSVHRMVALMPDLKKQLEDAKKAWEGGATSNEDFAKALRDVNAAAQGIDLTPPAEKAKQKKGVPASYDQQKIEVDEEEKHKQSLLKIRRESFEELAKETHLNEDEIAAQERKFNEEEFRITEAAIQRKLALQKQAKEEEKDLTLNAQLQEARDKKAEQDAQVDNKLAASKRKQSDENFLYLLRNLVKQGEEERKEFDERAKANIEYSTKVHEDETKAQSEEISANAAHQTKLLEAIRAKSTAELEIHRITAQEKMDIDARIDAAEETLQRNAIAREAELLDKGAADYLSKRQALETKLQELTDKRASSEAVRSVREEAEAYKVLGVESEAALGTQIREADDAVNRLRQLGASQGEINSGVEHQLELEIKLAELQGRDATAYIVALDNIKERQKALADSATSLGNVYTNLLKEIDSAMTGFSNSVAQALVAGKGFEKDIIRVFQNVEKEILGNLINTALKQLKDAIVGLGGSGGGLGALIGALSGGGAGGAGAASTAASTAAEAANTTAVTADTAATTALSPIIAALTAAIIANTAAVSANAASGFSSFADLLAVPLMAEGGNVLETGAAVVHAGEKIFDPGDSKQMSSLKAMFDSGVMSGGKGGPTVNFGHVGVGVTQRDMDNLMSMTIRALRRTGFQD